MGHSQSAIAKKGPGGITELDHHCRAGQGCAARTSTGAAITTKPDTLCHGCVQKLQLQLDELPTIRNVLRLYLVRGGSSAQTKVAFTSEPAPPLNIHALDLIHEIDDAIASAVVVADLVRQPNGVERALAIGKAWRKADDVIGISRPWQRRMAPCPKCDLPTLGNFAGSDTVQCSNCGGAMTRTEYERICIIKSK